MVDIYKSDAQMNGLSFDYHIEEKAVELFASNIMKAGYIFFENPMDTPFTPTWSRINSAIPDFLYRFKEAIERDNEIYKKWLCNRFIFIWNSKILAFFFSIFVPPFDFVGCV